MLQIEESRGALDVGEGFRAGHLLPLEHLARTERPFELAHEFLQVVLHQTVQGVTRSPLMSLSTSTGAGCGHRK